MAEVEVKVTNDSAPIRVMVVDDHRMFVDALRLYLEANDGIEVVGTESSGEDALALAGDLKPDVILMDYQMPGLDGVETSVRLRDVSPASKVVMLTALVDEPVLLAAIEAGCCGYITKDRAAEEVVAAVRAAHTGEALISPSMLARLLPKIQRSGSHSVGSDLTPRELQILNLLAEGRSNQSIADELVLSVHTIRNHVQNVITKLHAHSKLEAVATAVREGLLRQR